MLSSLLNVLKCNLVIARFLGLLDLQHRIIKVFLVGMFFQVLSEFPKSIPILQVPSGISCIGRNFSDLVANDRLFLIVELIVEALVDFRD